MDWAKALLALFQWLDSLSSSLRESKLIEEEKEKKATRADEIRKEVSITSKSIPTTSSLPDDGFRRD